MKQGFVIGWGGLSLINACLAQIKAYIYTKETGQKTMGGFGWWVWSLILGPAATFFILIFKEPVNHKLADHIGELLAEHEKKK